ncbi:class I SAM-dependent methyltransferase [Candidatus Poribacteria bacterium]|nr:class I SAM-dependent methyltransferase [Candidatus Poribacteria bacterium]
MLDNDIEKNNYTYWNKRALVYGTSHKGFKAICSYGAPYLYNKYIDLIHNKAFNRMIGSINIKNKKILDAGCGTGRWSGRLAEKGAIVTGADISSEMIKIAKKSMNRPIDFINASIADINLSSSSFDFITCVTVLQHVVDEIEFQKSISNLIRLIKKDGKLFILEVAPDEYYKKLYFSKILSIRSDKEYITAIEKAGALLEDSFSVDVIPFKHNLILYSQKIPYSLYYLLLHISLLISVPVDYLLSGTKLLRNYSWHKGFIFKRL